MRELLKPSRLWWLALLLALTGCAPVLVENGNNPSPVSVASINPQLRVASVVTFPKFQTNVVTLAVPWWHHPGCDESVWAVSTNGGTDFPLMFHKACGYQMPETVWTRTDGRTVDYSAAPLLASVTPLASPGKETLRARIIRQRGTTFTFWVDGDGVQYPTSEDHYIVTYPAPSITRPVISFTVSWPLVFPATVQASGDLVHWVDAFTGFTNAATFPNTTANQNFRLADMFAVTTPEQRQLNIQQNY